MLTLPYLDPTYSEFMSSKLTDRCSRIPDVPPTYQTIHTAAIHNILKLDAPNFNQVKLLSSLLS